MLCDNYRGIVLIDVAYKTVAICLKNRMNQQAEKILVDYQAGFRPNMATTDQTFTLKQILANSYERNIPVHILFVDFKQAYDSIKKDKLYEILGYLGIPKNMIRLTKLTLKNTGCKVLVDGKISHTFSVNK